MKFTHLSLKFLKVNALFVPKTLKIGLFMFGLNFDVEDENMKKLGLALLLSLSLFTAVVPVAQANIITDAVKVGGIGYVVKTFGSQINTFINKITLQKGAGNEFATKVVPIISIGTGKQIGAVQVTGSQALVNKTEAVLQVEGSLLGSVRVRALIPSDSVDPLKFNRVQGVGVSALVDISI